MNIGSKHLTQIGQIYDYQKKKYSIGILYGRTR